MKLSEIALALNLKDISNVSLRGISIDTRKIQPGDLFVAIKGPHFDGHDFIQEAVSKGAAAVLCQSRNAQVNIPQLVVPDTVEALRMAATRHREQLTALKVIALTGSNGKTTVKEMIASILPQPSFATLGNLNNHLGVPLNVLQLTPEHRYAVFELGASQMGDIAYTVAMVQPQVTLINNIAPAHIGGFGSIEGVARAKGEIHAGLSSKGTAIINADDAFAHAWDDLLKNKKVIHFSLKDPETIHAQEINVQDASFVLVTPTGAEKVQLQVPGLHNIANALAAAACLFALDLPLADIAVGLSRFRGVTGRLTYRSGKERAVIIDDTYNANLRSVLAALDVLAARPGRRVFVFGDMGELGPYSQSHHEEVGRTAKQLGIDELLGCGQESRATVDAFGAHGRHYATQADLIAHLLPELNASTTVLVKGSRSSAMEKIVHALVV